MRDKYGTARANLSVHLPGDGQQFIDLLDGAAQNGRVSLRGGDLPTGGQLEPPELQGLRLRLGIGIGRGTWVVNESL